MNDKIINVYLNDEVNEYIQGIRKGCADRDDIPEGIRHISMSVTLANRIADILELLILPRD